MYRKQPTLPVAVMAELRQAGRSGMTYRGLATRLDTTYQTIASTLSWIRRTGADPQPVTRWTGKRRPCRLYYPGCEPSAGPP